MPNRLLKEGIVDSDKINGLSAEAEVTFYRLLVVSDDLGRMDARTAIVRARCFPLKESSNLLTKIEIWLEELAKAGLIVRYQVDGAPYLAIVNWDQRVRSNGKYPAPPDTPPQPLDSSPPSIDGQLPAGGGLGLGMGKGMGASNENKVSFNAGAWTVPDLLKTQWGQAYPAIDVDGEMQKAAAWLLSNPKNLKSNYAKFLNGWFSRAQDKAKPMGGGQAQATLETFV